LFVEAFGDEYIKLALSTARAASTTARLVINEYGLEYDLTVERDRRYHFLKLIERLKQQDVPIDGIGLQAHLDLRKGKISQAHIESFLADVKSFGLFVFVTELDVTEAGYYESVEARDLSVADEVSRYLDVVCAYPDLKGVNTWGITDRYSWLGIAPKEVEALIEQGYWSDGSNPGLNRGLPLDADMRNKPFATSLDLHHIGKL
jgi:endo-1,4-beta-xylanase